MSTSQPANGNSHQSTTSANADTNNNQNTPPDGKYPSENTKEQFYIKKNSGERPKYRTAKGPEHAFALNKEQQMSVTDMSEPHFKSPDDRNSEISNFQRHPDLGSGNFYQGTYGDKNVVETEPGFGDKHENLFSQNAAARKSKVQMAKQDQINKQRSVFHKLGSNFDSNDNGVDSNDIKSDISSALAVGNVNKSTGADDMSNLKSTGISASDTTNPQEVSALMDDEEVEAANDDEREEMIQYNRTVIQPLIAVCGILVVLMIVLIVYCLSAGGDGNSFFERHWEQ